MYYPTRAVDEVQRVLDRSHLTYSLVLLPSLSIGGEFVKTQGHYHPAIPGTSYGYPEVYTQLYGRLLLFLQKRSRANPDTPLDCVLVDMTPGVTVTIPPEYAHVLINPTDSLALMAGLYSPDFKPEYTEVYEHRGLAYYILDQNGAVTIEPNPRYTNPPPLKQPATLTGTVFAPPHPGRPVWEAFITEPESYIFLTQPETMKAYFNLA
jgi:glucose-6-phosphate isomerase